MTRSGFISAATSAMSRKGQAATSLHACTFSPLIRQPVSPIRRMRAGAGLDSTSATPPITTSLVPLGKDSVQTTIGKSVFLSPRSVIFSGAPSRVAFGQYGAVVATRAREDDRAE